MATKDPIADLLGSVDLFRDLSRRELRAVAGLTQEVGFEPGVTVAAEGEAGGRFYLIVEGQARVRVQGSTKAMLGPGAYFGEISLIDGRPRSATVTAETALRTLSLATFNFRPLLAEHPAIGHKLLLEMCRRLRSAQQAAD